MSPPKWFVPNNRWLEVKINLSDDGKMLTLTAPDDQFEITIERHECTVSYSIRYPDLGRTYTGRVWWSLDNLKTAFGIPEESTRMHQSAGKYLVLGSYLNIPDVKTEGRGRSALSLLVTSEIREAVARFAERYGRGKE